MPLKFIPMKRLTFLLTILIGLQACQKDAGISNNSGSGYSAGNANFNGSGGGGGTGQGGSLARFTIARNHLFVVDDRDLYSYSLANSEHPQYQSKLQVGFDIETIYSYEDKLFVGSQNAMYVYSIADPGQPVILGEARHVRACDPVVANDTLAYVTVRSGNSCGGTVNALLVYDVSNVLNPVLRNTVPMKSPWGLGIRGNRLYVCDGTAGLVVYDLADAIHPQVMRKISNETFYDVIPTGDLMIAMVQGGTSLYSYGTGDSLVFMAKVGP